jgi:citrate lyase beta subunit
MPLSEDVLAELDRRLAPVDAARAAAFPGDRTTRQPVHTCYVPADAVVLGLAASWGDAALAALDEHGLPDLGVDPPLLEQVLPRVRAKLAAEPVEDLRVDAEDGYRGPPEREDDDVLRAAAAVTADLAAGTAPPSLGIRAKSLEAPTRRRGVRSLDLFLGGLAGAPRATVTLPKVTDVEQVRALLPVLDALEAAHGVPLDLELQVETPQSVVGPDGAVAPARLVHAAGPRLTGLHHGTYDYSAALGIAAAHQSSDHPAADLAKGLVQVAVAGTGAVAVDGSTNVLPVGDRDRVHAAWRLHAGLVRRALERGLYRLGPAPGPAGHPLHRHLRLLPRGAARRGGPAGGLPGTGGRRRARRAGHRAGAGHGRAARPGLRCPRRGGGARGDRRRPRRPRPPRRSEPTRPPARNRPRRRPTYHPLVMAE